MGQHSVNQLCNLRHPDWFFNFFKFLFSFPGHHMEPVVSHVIALYRVGRLTSGQQGLIGPHGVGGEVGAVPADGARGGHGVNISRVECHVNDLQRK